MGSTQTLRKKSSMMDRLRKLRASQQPSSTQPDGPGAPEKEAVVRCATQDPESAGKNDDDDDDGLTLPPAESQSQEQGQREQALSEGAPDGSKLEENGNGCAEETDRQPEEQGGARGANAVVQQDVRPDEPSALPQQQPRGDAHHDRPPSDSVTTTQPPPDADEPGSTDDYQAFLREAEEAERQRIRSEQDETRAAVAPRKQHQQQQQLNPFYSQRRNPSPQQLADMPEEQDEDEDEDEDAADATSSGRGRRAGGEKPLVVVAAPEGGGSGPSSVASGTGDSAVATTEVSNLKKVEAVRVASSPSPPRRVGRHVSFSEPLEIQGKHPGGCSGRRFQSPRRPDRTKGGLKNMLAGYMRQSR